MIVSDINFKQMKTQVLPTTIIGKILDKIYPAGQPLLASFNVTLVNNVIDLLRRLQDQARWKQAIANAVSSTINAIHEPLGQLEELCSGSVPSDMNLELESSSEALSMICVKL